MNRVCAARSRFTRGFTLIEIMVVIVILGVLAALVVPKIMSRPDEARIVAARQDISSILQALKLYRLANSPAATPPLSRALPRSSASPA